MSELVEKAKAIATKAHAGQKRWSGEPYITHPEAVAGMVRDLGEEYVAAAWLHDVLEDTDVTDRDLEEAGIPPAVRLAVDRLTRLDASSYVTHILVACSHPISRQVKRADLIHSISTLGPDKQVTLDKYSLALWIVENR